ncbi:hypothetical protein BCV70DRAFT_204623 [Testicularia cyperi]|uniref:Uncharacterized protein n=1 Tax=Testicularia cyperi TaxID=1882483 RepID=A0A317XU28_9BASI|nr:hypothetical protein BCV70DRAFT_204623 [Testicularia cyperi]
MSSSFGATGSLSSPQCTILPASGPSDTPYDEASSLEDSISDFELIDHLRSSLSLSDGRTTNPPSSSDVASQFGSEALSRTASMSEIQSEPASLPPSPHIGASNFDFPDPVSIHSSTLLPTGMLSGDHTHHRRDRPSRVGQPNAPAMDASAVSLSTSQATERPPPLTPRAEFPPSRQHINVLPVKQPHSEAAHTASNFSLLFHPNPRADHLKQRWTPVPSDALSANVPPTAFSPPPSSSFVPLTAICACQSGRSAVPTAAKPAVSDNPTLVAGPEVTAASSVPVRLFPPAAVSERSSSESSSEPAWLTRTRRWLSRPGSDFVPSDIQPSLADSRYEHLDQDQHPHCPPHMIGKGNFPEHLYHPSVYLPMTKQESESAPETVHGMSKQAHARISKPPTTTWLLLLIVTFLVGMQSDSVLHITKSGASMVAIRLANGAARMPMPSASLTSTGFINTSARSHQRAELTAAATATAESQPKHAATSRLALRDRKDDTGLIVHEVSKPKTATPPSSEKIATAGAQHSSSQNRLEGSEKLEGATQPASPVIIEASNNDQSGASIPVSSQSKRHYQWVIAEAQATSDEDRERLPVAMPVLPDMSSLVEATTLSWAYWLAELEKYHREVLMPALEEWKRQASEAARLASRYSLERMQQAWSAAKVASEQTAELAGPVLATLGKQAAEAVESMKKLDLDGVDHKVVYEYTAKQWQELAKSPLADECRQKAAMANNALKTHWASLQERKRHKHQQHVEALAKFANAAALRRA